MNYIVIEIQKNSEGVVSTIVTTFADRRQAESKYYEILKFAALSDIPTHGAVIIGEDGNLVRQQVYRNEA